VPRTGSIKPLREVFALTSWAFWLHVKRRRVCTVLVPCAIPWLQRRLLDRGLLGLPLPCRWCSSPTAALRGSDARRHDLSQTLTSLLMKFLILNSEMAHLPNLNVFPYEAELPVGSKVFCKFFGEKDCHGRHISFVCPDGSFFVISPDDDHYHHPN
jgi:hypothetical protein